MSHSFKNNRYINASIKRHDAVDMSDLSKSICIEFAKLVHSDKRVAELLKATNASLDIFQRNIKSVVKLHNACLDAVEQSAHELDAISVAVLRTAHKFSAANKSFTRDDLRAATCADIKLKKHQDATLIDARKRTIASSTTNAQEQTSTLMLATLGIISEVDKKTFVFNADNIAARALVAKYCNA